MNFRASLCAVSLWLLAAHGNALAFGDSGHSIVAELAQRRLSEKTLTAIADLIGAGTSLASLSTWADDFKFTSAGTKTKRWHFIDVDIDQPNPTQACALDPNEGDCIVAALKREITLLSDKTASRNARADALRFVVHLLGDLHQPLHCSERKGDGGGNGLAVTFQGKGPDGKPRTTDLSFHQLWDETLISAHSFSWGSYTAELEITLVPGLTPGSLQGDYIANWANECFTAGVAVYRLLPAAAVSGRFLVDEAYQKQAQPILDRSLALAGMRLGAVLNEALGK